MAIVDDHCFFILPNASFLPGKNPKVPCAPFLFYLTVFLPYGNNLKLLIINGILLIAYLLTDIINGEYFFIGPNPLFLLYEEPRSAPGTPRDRSRTPIL